MQVRSRCSQNMFYRNISYIHLGQLKCRLPLKEFNQIIIERGHEIEPAIMIYVHVVRKPILAPGFRCTRFLDQSLASVLMVMPVFSSLYADYWTVSLDQLEAHWLSGHRFLSVGTSEAQHPGPTDPARADPKSETMQYNPQETRQSWTNLTGYFVKTCTVHDKCGRNKQNGNLNLSNSEYAFWLA
jgi:hypothetical protein